MSLHPKARAENALQSQLRGLLESIPYGVVALDTSDNVVLCNSAAERLLGARLKGCGFAAAGSEETGQVLHHVLSQTAVSRCAKALFEAGGASG